jgi:hypothetical protein
MLQYLCLHHRCYVRQLAGSPDDLSVANEVMPQLMPVDVCFFTENAQLLVRNRHDIGFTALCSDRVRDYHTVGSDVIWLTYWWISDLEPPVRIPECRLRPGTNGGMTIIKHCQNWATLITELAYRQKHLDPYLSRSRGRRIVCDLSIGR